MTDPVKVALIVACIPTLTGLFKIAIDFFNRRTDNKTETARHQENQQLWGRVAEMAHEHDGDQDPLTQEGIKPLPLNGLHK